LGKRLWSSRLSPTARREKAATDVIRQLTAHAFTQPDLVVKWLNNEVNFIVGN